MGNVAKWADRIALAVVVWLLGSAVGIGLYWLVWRSTSCESKGRNMGADCGVSAHDWDFWAPWPFLLGWVVLVGAVVGYIFAGAVKEIRAEARNADSTR